MPADRIGAVAPRVPELPDIVFEPDIDKAIARVQEGAATVVVTGSFHTVGGVMARLPGLQPMA